jgi:hypothetical protein
MVVVLDVRKKPIHGAEVENVLSAAHFHGFLGDGEVSAQADSTTVTVLKSSFERYMSRPCAA